MSHNDGMERMEPEMPEARVMRYANPIRAAIAEAKHGDMETALAIARGDLPVVLTDDGKSTDDPDMDPWSY